MYFQRDAESVFNGILEAIVLNEWLPLRLD